ncbi:hypothetical protein EGJ23_01485 [Pseudomonas sp. o96-267]|uniref:hypothetical protein n=1 Tax=Pseudomonas sp. o96-267 TaxID=2479853 RepID=UPI000F767D4D|nr:hypothetical protein [Pseudomonas sp. o96-267]RRV29636.1 hypothetical protein EGJ23_01485 [Pseudomonas sp. o96-267]
MGDRELLELAAMAAGIEFEWRQKRIQTGPADTWGVRPCREEPCPFLRAGLFWNPLIDDGDALRLAVKLDLHVQCDFTEEESKVYVYGAFLGNGIEEEPGELDKYGATRRAIVRAAAEIGKAGAK